jgi:CheY-like chemotaxis protein
MGTSGEPCRPEGRARILLVQGEQLLRDLEVGVLSRGGYDTVAADTSAAAIASVARNREKFDLLVTDVEVPGMKGMELVRRVRERQPDLPVLFVSGYPSELISAGDLVRWFAPKPFSPPMLLEMVHYALCEWTEEPTASEPASTQTDDALSTSTPGIGRPGGRRWSGRDYSRAPRTLMSKEPPKPSSRPDQCSSVCSRPGSAKMATVCRL